MKIYFNDKEVTSGIFAGYTLIGIVISVFLIAMIAFLIAHWKLFYLFIGNSVLTTVALMTYLVLVVDITINGEVRSFLPKSKIKDFIVLCILIVSIIYFCFSFFS